MKLDAKFTGEIRKIKNGAVVPEDEYVVFLAQDTAFYLTLPTYRRKCIELGCDPEQIAALDRMWARLTDWRSDNPDRCKVPGAAGEILGDIP
jgi:hypothetical protein